MAPLLSVIVPAYGVGEYLPSCLDSMLAQTLTDLEIIVVDDGSPDECGEIADDYAAFDPRVKVLHTPNQGLGPARNTGAEHATGRYLTFADSDDLIPPRAYELLVTSLESTGSDIAAGNTWRYIEGKGNVQSWTHAEAFAETQLATHIRKFPTLIRDRMVWNKVYRRSFWEAGGYQFPAIRYEDYPVTLPAHLDAKSVDILSDKVYLWRQRLAEDSITQRSLELDNLSDRVTSAEMTLDVADAEGGEIRRRMHSYFTDIDIVTLATALAEGEEADREEIGRLATRLARRLDPSYEWTTPLARRIHAALRRGDVEAAAALAELRRGGSRGDVVRTFLSPGRLAQVPGLVTDLAFGGRTRPKLKGRRLRSRVMDVVRVGDGFVIQVESKLRRLLLERATIGVELVAGDEAVPVESSVAALSGQRATVEVNLTDALIQRLADEPHELVVNVTVGPLTWSGGVSFPRDKFPEPVQLADGSWAVVSRWDPGSHDLWVRRVAGESAAEVHVADDALLVRVRPGTEHVAVLRPAPSAPLIADVVDGVARMPLADVVDDPADDPVSSRAFRDIVALTSDAAERLRPSVFATSALVGEATGAAGDGHSRAVVGSMEPDVVPEGTELSRPDPDERRREARHIEHVLERSGITPLLLVGRSEGSHEVGEHVVSVMSSPSGTAELKHQRRDHLPRR